MPKRILQGTVVSDKNDKTVVVRVERRFAHPILQKTVRRSKKYKAHDENNQFKVGDLVPSRNARRFPRTSAGRSFPPSLDFCRFCPPDPCVSGKYLYEARN